MKTAQSLIALALAAGATLLGGCHLPAPGDGHVASDCGGGHAASWAILTVEDTTYVSESGAQVRVITQRTQTVLVPPGQAPDGVPAPSPDDTTTRCVEPAAAREQQPRGRGAARPLRLTSLAGEDMAWVATNQIAERK